MADKSRHVKEDRTSQKTHQVDFLIGSFLALSSFGTGMVTKALDAEGSGPC